MSTQFRKRPSTKLAVHPPIDSFFQFGIANRISPVRIPVILAFKMSDLSKPVLVDYFLHFMIKTVITVLVSDLKNEATLFYFLYKVKRLRNVKSQRLFQVNMFACI